MCPGWIRPATQPLESSYHFVPLRVVRHDTARIDPTAPAPSEGAAPVHFPKSVKPTLTRISSRPTPAPRATTRFQCSYRLKDLPVRLVSFLCWRKMRDSNLRSTRRRHAQHKNSGTFATLRLGATPHNNRFNLTHRGRHAFRLRESRAGTPPRVSFPGHALRATLGRLIER